MNAQETVSVVLPFSGFYNSIWSLDSEHESEAYNLTESNPGLSESDASDILYRCTTGNGYRAAMESVAKDYARGFSHEFADRAGFPLPLEFEELVSPREYNFTTDRIFARVPVDAFRDIAAAVIADGRLSAVALERFRARSGFIPFSEYKGGDITQWPADPAEWDHNMAGCVIAAALPDESDLDFYETLEGEIYERLSCNGDLCEAFSLTIDWPAVENAIAEELGSITGEA